MSHFDISKLERELKDLEAETLKEDFWQDTKNSNKVFIVAILAILALIVTRYINASSNIKSIYTVIYVLLYIIIGISMMINDVITQHLINRKLKQIKIH